MGQQNLYCHQRTCAYVRHCLWLCQRRFFQLEDIRRIPYKCDYYDKVRDRYIQICKAKGEASQGLLYNMFTEN